MSPLFITIIFIRKRTHAHLSHFGWVTLVTPSLSLAYYNGRYFISLQVNRPVNIEGEGEDL